MWCGDCVRSKALLDRSNVDYDFFNVDEDNKANEYVVKVNAGKRSIPVIIFPDGTHLTEPSDLDLKVKLQDLGLGKL